MKIAETRKINSHDLYHLCIEKDWYTCGTNAEYELMFGKAVGNMTTEKLCALAMDIVDHSAPKCFADCDSDPVFYVMFELAEISHSFFEMGE